MDFPMKPPRSLLDALTDEQRSQLAALAARTGRPAEELMLDALVAWDRSAGGTAKETATERWFRQRFQAGDPPGPDDLAEAMRAAVTWWLSGAGDGGSA